MNAYIISIFYLMAALLGGLCVYFGLDIQNQLSDSPCGETVNHSASGVVVLGTMVLTASLTMLFQEYNTGSSQNYQNHHGMIFYLFLVAMAITMTTLGGLLRNHASKNIDGCKKIKQKSDYIMYTGIFLILVTLGPVFMYFTYKGGGAAYEHYKGSSAFSSA